MHLKAWLSLVPSAARHEPQQHWAFYFEMAGGNVLSDQLCSQVPHLEFPMPLWLC